MSKALALDIETTGLDPREHSIVAVGVADSRGTRAFLGNEAVILRDIEDHIGQLPPGSLVITWNGEEFDLPFLRNRFDALDIPTALALRSKEGRGKYGKPLYYAAWGGLPHVDIAPLLRRRAEQLGVRWSLKPVARALLNLEPVEVDNAGASIAVMDRNVLTSYVLSDATITFDLACYLDDVGELTSEEWTASRSAQVSW